MLILARHVVHQHKMLTALGSIALQAVLQRFQPRTSAGVSFRHEPVTARVQPPPRGLIRDYLHHLGGEPDAYERLVPPHLFPQWCLPLAAQTLRGLPLPLLRIVNSGCRLELNAPLSADEPFEVQASLESLQSEQGRTLLLQRIITSQPARPQALVVNLRAVVSSSPGSKRSRPEPVRVPHAAKRIDSWSLSRDAGLNFAWLTGDFNPIHWLPAYARAFGFESSILHGFATMARVLTALEMRVFGGATDAVSVLDVRFTRPLGLPATVGLFVDKETVFVGAAGEPAYLVGTFTASAGARCVSHEAQSFEPSQEARA